MSMGADLAMVHYVQIMVIFFFLWRLAIYSYRFTLDPLSKYPGPKLAAMTDWYLAYHALNKRQHLKTYQDHQKYGPVVRHGPNKLVFNSQQALHDIYQSERTNKVHSYLVTQIKADVYSVFNCIDKRLHKIKRRMISKALSEQKMRQFEPVMLEQIKIFLKQLLKASHSNEPVNMSDRCKRLGVDVIGRFGFGYHLNLQTEETNAFVIPGLIGTSYQHNVYIQAPMVKYFGLSFFFPRLYALRMKYIFLLRKLVKDRLAEGKAAKEDLFSYVMDAKDTETGTKIRLSELISEATFFFPAGGDTTATTITAVFFYLSRNPACYKKAMDEIRTTFSSSDDIRSGPLPSSCVYLRAAIDEALRICPPAPGTLWRELPVGDPGSEEPLTIDGHLVPAGTWVGVNMYAIHHNEQCFPEPFAYRPERWLAEADTAETLAARKKLRDVFSPFGVSSRSCTGKAMAYMEASLTLALTMWHFDFEVTKDARLANIGGGKFGDTTGRDRLDEFQTYDEFISSHHGPYLSFTARVNYLHDLE